MKTLKVNFEHCNGITKLEHEFKFSNRSFAIYAPNGTMKTSFAKTFNEYSSGIDSKDNAFPDNPSIREIIVDNINQIEKESILVIEPYNENYRSEKITTLLANKESKEQYEELHRKINEHQTALLKKLKTLSGIGKEDNVIAEIKKNFGKDFIDAIKNLDLSITPSENELSKFKISEILNDKVKIFLADNSNVLNDYVSKYNELLNQSKYLKKGFNFYNIETINKQLETNNFFKHGHSIQLSDGEFNTNLKTSKEIEELCEQEKTKISTDPELLRKFDLINKKLDANNELRNLRSLLIENPNIILKLGNLTQFEKDIWCSYLYAEKELLEKLVQEYTLAQEEIKQIIEIVNKQITSWEDAIEIFNDRFIYLPFSLKISNKSDSILNGNVPVIIFEFQSKGKTRHYNENEKKELLSILSTGEKRALYILNIIFEIEARKKIGLKSLLIIDDIADSFDYKNKYAVIDYLKHISELDQFSMIILTHNFDFYRTILSRNIVPYIQCLMAIKAQDHTIQLIKAKYLKNPFKALAKNINSEIIIISLIPFVRNLIEYIEDEESDDYLKLTSLLHHKSNTMEIKLSDVQKIFNKVNITIPLRFDLNEYVVNLIARAAEECLVNSEGINLENKLVLSIIIRLKTEEFMLSKIDDAQFKTDLNLSKNQTWLLVKKYSEMFNNEKEVLKIINRVSLITPENIHINSFMYEPILDMGDIELKKLYADVKQIESKLIQ